MIKKLTMLFVAVAAMAAAAPAFGAEPEAVKPNYELAERFSPTKVKRLVPQTAVRPNWFPVAKGSPATKPSSAAFALSTSATLVLASTSAI
ncbi:MAG: hypothetical protein II204_06235, partial [Alistipes sp.]|nr:hypothetical protein [Alistipes sp.]